MFSRKYFMLICQ